MNNLDALESSVLGTVLVYPHLQKRMVNVLGRYQFGLDIRQIVYVGIKRIVEKESIGQKIIRKPLFEEWKNSVNPDNPQAVLLDNVLHNEIFLVINELTYNDYKKYKCTKEDLGGYLKVCMHQKGVYDIIRFNKILIFMVEQAINNKIAERYWEITKEISKHGDIDTIINKNNNLLKNLNKWVEELDKRFKENF